MKPSRQQIRLWLIFIGLVAVPIIFGEITRTYYNDAISIVNGAISIVFYTAFVVAWGTDMRNRVVQPQLKNMLRVLALLILLWFTLRNIKYHVLRFFEGTDGIENIKRYIWYLYYIPMLGIATVLPMAAMSLRKPETYRVPKPTVVTLLSIYAVLFLAVITNDLHQLVFKFPNDAVVFSDLDYSYSVLYYPCFIWMAGCVATAIIIMIKKCNIPYGGKARFIPLVIMALWGFYCVAYVVGTPRFFRDIIVVDCISVIVLIETSIAIGLIPTNTRYVELLKASDISAIITDKQFEPIYFAKKAVIPKKELLELATQTGVVTKDGVRLSAYEIKDGFAFWRDDMTELLEINEELWELRKELEEQYAVEREKYITSKSHQSLAEKNRLYNIMQNQTKSKVTALYALIDQFENCEEEDGLRRITAEIAVLCAYLKRRNNLLFINEGSGVIDGKELTYCIKESLSNFELCGAKTRFESKPSRLISFENITRLYDAFEVAIEAALHNTEEMFVTLFDKAGTVALRINVVCDINLLPMEKLGFVVEDEGGGEWVLCYDITEATEGGAK